MILLDTATIVYDALDISKLSSKAMEKIKEADLAKELIISDISIFEISSLIQNKQILMNESPANFIQLYLDYRHIDVIPIRAEIAELAVSFDQSMNFDSFDKIIAASSIILGATLITDDKNLLKNTLVQTLW